MKQFLLKVAGYGLLVIVLMNVIAFATLFFLARSNFYKPQFVKNGVPEKNFDYAVLGSSTGLTTLDTETIDSLTGKKGLNLSMDDSGLSSQYLMLLLFYSLQKNIRYLVLSITPWDMALANPSLNDNDYRFLPEVKEKCVYDYYKQLETSSIKVLAYSRYFPILGVSYYNTELFYPGILAALHPGKRNRFDTKGNYNYPSTGGGPEESAYHVTNLEIHNPYFFKIKQFCVDHQISLLLYQSPMYKTKVISAEPSFINQSDLLHDATFFYDNIHVNNKGRKICSEQFADYFKKLN